MKKINVSVLMCEYNTPLEYLEKSIESILKQTFKDFEFLIIDDGTKNDMEALEKKFNDKRIKIIKNDKNRGLVYSLNRGLQEAQGEYIVRMDTDDIALPTRIEKIYDYIKSHSEYSVVGSKAIEFSDIKTNNVIGFSGEIDSHRLMCAEAPLHPTVILNKKDALEVGGYPNYNRCEDFALWCELLLTSKKIYILDEPLLKYRVNDTDYDKKRKLKMRKDELRARKFYYKKMNANFYERLYILRSILASILPFWIVRKIRSKKDAGK